MRNVGVAVTHLIAYVGQYREFAGNKGITGCNEILVTWDESASRARGTAMDSIFVDESSFDGGVLEHSHLRAAKRFHLLQTLHDSVNLENYDGVFITRPDIHIFPNVGIDFFHFTKTLF